MTTPPVIIGVRNCGNNALSKALGLGRYFHPDNSACVKQIERHRHVIVPLRAPISVAISWYRRSGWPHPVYLPRRFEMLARLLERAERVSFVCMDLPIRVEQFAALRSVAELPPAPVRPLLLPLEVLAALYEKYAKPIYSHEFVSRFYGAQPDVSEIVDTERREQIKLNAVGGYHVVYSLDDGRRKR